MSQRLSLAVPIDVARAMDATATQTQIDADTFQSSSDDSDLLASWIEDAEDEFRQRTDADMRIGRVGVAGQRTTYEHATYRLSGHKAYRQTFSHYTFDYDYDEVTVNLENDRLLPFDSSQGDQILVYKGLGGDESSAWEDITDEQWGMWAVISHPKGKLNVHPEMLHEALMKRYGRLPGGNQRLQKLRLAISYRYGALGGDRDRAARTELDETGGLDASQTDTVSVADGARFPTGSEAGPIVVLVDREYLLVTPSPGTDEMTIHERGIRGTTADSHDDAASVLYTPPGVRKAVAARAAMELVKSGRYDQFIPDSEDDLDQGDVLDELRNVWETTVSVMSGGGDGGE